jgi:hypothetical protein
VRDRSWKRLDRIRDRNSDETRCKAYLAPDRALVTLQLMTLSKAKVEVAVRVATRFIVAKHGPVQRGQVVVIAARA